MAILDSIRVKRTLTLPATFIFMILFIAMILIISNWVSYTGSMKRISSRTMNQINSEVSNTLTQFRDNSTLELHKVEAIMKEHTFGEFIEGNGISSDLLQILHANSMISQLYFGSSAGGFYQLSRDSSDGFMLKYTSQKNEGTTCFFGDSTGEFKEFSECNYTHSDPRNGEWYKSSVTAEKEVWSDEYRFYINSDRGILISMPVVHSDSLLGVVGIDYSRENLICQNTFLNGFENSLTFIADSQGNVLNSAVKNGFTAGSDSIYSEFCDFVVKLSRSKSKTGEFAFKRNGLSYNALVNTGECGQIVAFVIENRDLSMSAGRFGTVFSASLIGLIIIAAFVYLLFRLLAAPISELRHQITLLSSFKLYDSTLVDSCFKEFNQIGKSFNELQQWISSFLKFVPTDVIRQVMNKAEFSLIGEDRYVSIMFMDIAGFSKISQHLTPSEQVNFISDFFQEMSTIVIDHGGTVDNYIGDTIMAFWNAPIYRANHEQLACEAALACLARLKELQIEWTKRELPDVSVRIGIHSDSVTVGHMGAQQRFNYSIIGDGVNLTAFFKGLGRIYGVPLIISENVAGRLPDDVFNIRPLDCVVAREDSDVIPIYTINREQCKSVADLHRGGFEHYRKREWDEAQESFQEILVRDEKDIPANLFLARIASLKNNPPGEKWDGVFHNEQY